MERVGSSEPERPTVDLSLGRQLGGNGVKACKKRDKMGGEVSTMTDQIFGLRVELEAVRKMMGSFVSVQQGESKV